MKARIIQLAEKKLVGFSTQMSLVNNKTAALWQQLMPRMNEIDNKCSTDKISLQCYPEGYFQDFNPQVVFKKWATVEVKDFTTVPSGMDTLILPAGQYAVFDYKGSSADPSIFRYIFSTWLPQSGYQIDDRPHFEVLGEKYKNNDPESEEEIWIPIK